MGWFARRLDSLSEKSPRFSRFREWCKQRRKKIRVAYVIIIHLLGALSTIQAVMTTRTPQGAIAWAISLNTLPTLTVPAYWIFGSSNFDGYEPIRHARFLSEDSTNQKVTQVLREQEMLFEPQTKFQKRQKAVLERLAKMPITQYNNADLLIDGEETFDAIFAAIDRAEEYVLVEFYIIRNDELGNRLKEALIAKANEGVRTYMLYDGLGSRELPESYLNELHEAGVETARFATTRGAGNRFRINFRNHRKIVVVDGKEAFVGGHNVGDEYVGKHPELTPWRDTHVAIRGPVVLETQVAFVEDWRWATGETPKLNWIPEKAETGNVRALCIPTGPADEIETGTLWMLNMIDQAEESIWIATPYFVPDMQFVSALQLAALRGVDVRVIIPENNDDRLVDLTSYSYLEEMTQVGVRFYRYQPGFMHQKVILVDGKISAIGTANFDNRSMRLNFEITILLEDEKFSQEVKAMLENDLLQCRDVSAKEYTDSAYLSRFIVRFARLLAPIQ